MKREKQYAVAPDGRIVEKHPYAPLKGGWRLATEGDLQAAADAEDVRSARESRDAAAEHDHQRQASDEAGREQKERDAQNASNMAAKAAAQKQTRLTEPEPVVDADPVARGDSE